MHVPLQPFYLACAVPEVSGRDEREHCAGTGIRLHLEIRWLEYWVAASLNPFTAAKFCGRRVSSDSALP